MHIDGHVIAKFIDAFPDRASDDLQLAVVLPGETQGTPLRTTEGEPLTLGDLREVLSPFHAWMGED